ncbi:S9 family peptidase [Hufsiella ginkgonis]|uniref:Prolyl oligopeptidase family serine peptidase n=1 Tax=Hufsiella ginkgonis TaxID=2695274 RepID=A0A7K1Y306_9SPHI|nr:S9 family peptidase [Hufsiella ginkgonis]MXV17612.1 prolyl oligopeptidase family serine peptidase [Hufsiella ginkgonis]
MLLKFKRLSAWLILCVCVACTGEEAKMLPFESFFANPVKTSFLISPDGNFISYLQPYKNRLNLYVQTVDGKQVNRITNETDRNISSYFWANNNEMVYMKDRADDEGVRLFVVDKVKGAPQDLLPPGKFKAKLINPNRLKNNELIIALNKRDSSVFDVYRLNIPKRKLEMAAQNPGNITEWYADEDGQIRLALSSDGVNETLLFRESEGQGFKPVITSNFKTTIAPVGFCGKERTCIYALSNQNRDKMALVEFNCKTGKEEKIIFSHPDVDVIEGGYSTTTRRVLYATYETSKKHRHYLDDSVKNVYQQLEKQLPNTEVRINGRDAAEKKFIIRTFTDRSPGAFYLYTLADNKLLKLSDVNALLPESELCEMKPISFKSRDGLLLNGYLTLPKGKKVTDLPVVVIPRSNPEYRNSWGFNSEVQFLANRGYAVFQVNCRGSLGYGKEFWIAGFKKWGTGIQDDMTDGVKWLIGQKIADPKRIAIYGNSFGGYSALVGLYSHPELYKCGVSYSGLTNLFTHLKAVPPYFKPYLQMIYEKVGSPEKDADYFRAVSPVFHTDRFKAPVLIAQGAKDPRVNVNETNQFVKELKKRGVPITYILKENEGHNFRNQENRQEFYRSLEKFLADNLNKK